MSGGRILLSIGLVAAVLASACSVKDPKQASAPVVYADAPSRSAAPAPGTSGNPSVAAPDDTAALVAPGPPRAPDASLSTPPRAGTYRFTQSGDTKFGTFSLPFDPEGTLVVNPPKGERQEQERRYSDSRTRAQTLLFRSDAVFLDEATERFGSGPTAQEVRCDTEEPLRILVLPLKVGASWSAKGTCNGITLAVRSTVRRTEARTVDGTKIDTFVVHSSYDVSGDGYEQSTEQDTWISPAFSMVVRAVEHSTGSAQGASFTRELTEDLVSLDPS